MSEEKKCPYCGKKLRVDNTRGACSVCLSEGKPVPSSAAAPKATMRVPFGTARVEVAAPKHRGDEVDRALVMAKFRTVAEALGFDPDELLAEAAQAWLEGAGAAVKAASEAEE